MTSEAVPEAGQSLPPCTVLVADDDDDQRFLLSWVLQKAGFTTIDVHSGVQVVPLAHAQRPDVILLDIHMPDQDGFTTAKLLKGDAAVANIPIIFLTGRMDAADRSVALDLGADDLLLKSTEADELVRCVRAAFDRRRAQPAQSPE
jgi:DNA-binding response OmpR family regulator